MHTTNLLPLELSGDDDMRFSAVHLLDLVHTAFDRLIDRESGIWHLANHGAVTALESLAGAARQLELDTTRIDAVSAWSLHRPALRPRNRALQSVRGQLLPSFEDALRRDTAELPSLAPEMSARAETFARQTSAR